MINYKLARDVNACLAIPELGAVHLSTEGHRVYIYVLELPLTTMSRAFLLTHIKLLDKSYTSLLERLPDENPSEATFNGGDQVSVSERTKWEDP